MEKTPKSMRLQIGLFGRTNVGKSSFLNYVAGQDVALTSDIPGTTTDIVEKAMELLPIGPVLFLDTGGLDDRTALASGRVARTAKAFDRGEIAVLIAEPDTWTDFEEHVVVEADRRNMPVIVVVNKVDNRQPSNDFLKELGEKTAHVITCSCLDADARDKTVTRFKDHLIQVCPDDFVRPAALVGDLLPPGGLAVLIVPIDLEAPKGRLILPQVQTIRDALDNDAATLVVKEREYREMLERLNRPPDLVVCDSQVVMKMVADTPPGVPCTTFSILFARFKGDLVAEARGAAAINSLREGSKVLIAEACTHHALPDDIGRVKIPRWLSQYTGLELQIDVLAGRDYPDRLEQYDLIIHCGACMLGRKEMLWRLQQAHDRKVPITNYGVSIAFLHGVLETVLRPFPAARHAFQTAMNETQKDQDHADVVTH